MGDFDVIETGVDYGNETINFGKTSFGDGTLYEISTVACLKSSGKDQGENNIVINSFYINGHVVLAINKLLRIFSELSLSELIFEQRFDSDIVAFSTYDQNFLLVVLANGQVNILDIASDQKDILFSEVIVKQPIAPDDFISAFEDNAENDLASFVLVLFNGKVVRIHIKESCESDDSTYTIYSEEMYDLQWRIKSAHYNYSTLVASGDKFCILNLDTNVIMYDLVYDVKKVYFTGSIILIVLMNGSLLLKCPYTFITHTTCECESLEDMMVLQCDKEPQVFGVEKKDDNCFFIKLFKLDMEPVFSLKSMYPIELMRCENRAEEMLFLSKIKNKSSAINELRLQTVIETDPEMRLKKLIKRHMFTEAELFAKLYGLDSLVIAKAKAQVITDKSGTTSKDIDDLIQLMNQIDDHSFNLMSCKMVDCSSLDDIKRILCYATKIKVKSNASDQDAALCLKDEFSGLLFRFQTYLYLDPTGDVQSWLKFSSSSLLEEIKIRLRHYQIQEAIILYSRLDKLTVKNELTCGKVDEILIAIDSLPLSSCEQFLPTFIPLTITYLPASLDLFVRWLFTKIQQIEAQEPLNFVEKAINFAGKVTKLLNVEENNSLLFQRQFIANKTNFDLLKKLMDGLRIVRELKSKFFIDVAVKQCLEDPRDLVRTLFGINMTPERFNILLKDFLYDFMSRNHFDVDEVLRDEIRTLMKYKNCIAVITITLGYIRSIKTKLETIIDILKYSPVPWSDEVRTIGRNALKHNHPLATKICSMMEEEPITIVLSKPIYKIKIKGIINDREFRRIVKRILYVDQPSMLDDIYQLCSTSARTIEASRLIINSALLKGDAEKAYSVIVRLSSKEQFECLEQLLLDADIVQNDCWPQLYKERFSKSLQLISMITGKSEDISDEQNMLIIQRHTELLGSVYNINETFQRQVRKKDLLVEDTQKEILDELLETVATTSKESKHGSNVLDICNKLASHFFTDEDYILVDLCNKVGNLEFAIKTLEHLHNTNNTNSRNLCLMVVLVMKFMESQSIQPMESFNSTFMTSNESNDLLQEHSFLNALKLCQDVTSTALFRAVGSAEIAQVMEVMDWVSIGYDLTSKKTILHTELLKNEYPGDQAHAKHSVFNAIADHIQLYARYIGKLDPLNSSILSDSYQGSKVTEQDVLHQISALKGIVEDFVRQGLHLTAHAFQATFKSRFLNSGFAHQAELNNLTIVLRKVCLPQLINAVASAKYTDMYLLYNLLLESGDEYYKYIRYFLSNYKRQPKKLQDIALIGLRLIDVHQQTDHKYTLEVIIMTCKWWNKLNKTNGAVPYEEFLKIPIDKRLKKLIELDLIDLTLIEDYCKDFSLDAQVFYKKLLQRAIKKFEVEYECKTQANGKRTIIIKQDEKILHAQCQKIIDKIDDKTSIFSWLEEILNGLNFYQYEKFMCILKILMNNSERSNEFRDKISVLAILKPYERSSSPSQREQEEWYFAFPESLSLDPLSEFRLPFSKILFTSDIWSIIRPEINLKTYTFWYGISPKLNLKRDDVCVYAMKELVSSGVLGNHQSNDWIVYPRFTELFAEVDECAKKIVSLERASSVIYHLMTYTPNGADKVNAAALSYKYAKKYREQNPHVTDIDKAYTKVKNKYNSFSVMNILYKHNLFDQTYLELVTDPEKLIKTLYMDDRILNQEDASVLGCPDINRAVDEIAEFYQFKSLPITTALLHYWLKTSSSKIDLDSTVVTYQQGPHDSDENLKRAIYLCSNQRTRFWQKYLLDIGQSEDPPADADTTTTSIKENGERSFFFKARALKCFCAITDELTISSLTDVSYEEILDFIGKLILLSDLEGLGITLTLDDLNNLDMKNLLKKISQIASPAALRVMGKTCMTYRIYDARYWDYILKNTMKLGLVVELKTYLEFLKGKVGEIYSKAWQMVIDSLFQDISCMDDETLINNFLKIQVCPDLSSLDFEKAISKCIQARKYAFAAILVPYLPENKREDLFERLSNNNDDLLKELDRLEQCGIWGVGRVKKLMMSSDF